MNLTRETVDKAVVVSPEGEVDMHESPKLRTLLLAEIAKKPSRVVVDLAKVTFMDSSGVATMVEALKKAKATGLPLLLCGMTENVKDVFELSRLDKVFTILAGRAEALGA